MSELIINNYVIGAPVIDILRKVKSECNNGKLRIVEDKGEYVRVTCPVHKGGMELNPSCSVYCGNGDLQKGWYNCLTCGSKGPLYKFIANCFEISEQAAKTWLIENFGDGYISNRLELEPITFDKKVEQKENIIDQSILNQFESYHPYMTKRKLTDEVISKFEIKYDPLSKSIVFPVRDISGNLVGLTRRSIEGKKFHIDKGFNKSNIYLLYYIISNNIKEVIVCESQINALTCWAYGKAAIALFGAGTTEEQMEALNNTDIKHYILCYDPDPAGRKGANRFKKYIRKDVFVDDILLPENKDINDLTEDEFNSLVYNYCKM